MRPGRRLAAAVGGKLAVAPGRRRLVASVLGALAALAAALALAAPTADVGARSPAALASPPLSVREARLAVLEHRAISRVLSYTSRVSHGGGSRVREVALTFDDGPGPDTPAIIAILKRLHVPSTFFQVGTAIARYPRFARTELETGLGIGDHTATHPFLAALAPAAQRAEIVDAARRIHSYGAPYPRLFRPPYESYDRTTVRLLRGDRMLMVLWSVDTRDFSQPGVGAIAQTTFAEVRPGAIVLMHDGGGPRAQTVAALPRVIRGLRRRGYRLVTVGRLLLDDPPPSRRRVSKRPPATSQPGVDRRRRIR